MSFFRWFGIGKKQQPKSKNVQESKAPFKPLAPPEQESLRSCVRWVMQHSKQGPEFKQWYDKIVAADTSGGFQREGRNKEVFYFSVRCATLDSLELYSSAGAYYSGKDSLPTPGFSINPIIFSENELQNMVKEVTPNVKWEAEFKGFEVRGAKYYRKPEREYLFRVVSFEEFNNFIGLTKQMDYGFSSNLNSGPERVGAIQHTFELPPTLTRLVATYDVDPKKQEEIRDQIETYIYSKFKNGVCRLTVEDFYRIELIKNPDLKNYVADQKDIQTPPGPRL